MDRSLYPEPLEVDMKNVNHGADANRNPTADLATPAPSVGEQIRKAAEIPPDTNKEHPSVEAWTEKELDEMAARAAEQIVPLSKQDDDIGFSYGRIALANHEKVLKGGRRVPDKEDTYKRLARKLEEMRIKKLSHQRLRALANACRLRGELGGPGKAPTLSPDHYIEVDHDGLSLDDKRIILETAAEKAASSLAVRKHVQIKLGELGKEPERDEAYWRDWLDKSIAQFEAGIMKTRIKVKDQGVEISSCTRDHLNYLAVYIYQFANQSGPEDVK